MRPFSTSCMCEARSPLPVDPPHIAVATLPSYPPQIAGSVTKVRASCKERCKATPMEIDVLFASVAVRDLDLSRAWYDRFFGRPADIVPNDDEVMWKATDTAWLYVIRDGARVLAMASSPWRYPTLTIRRRRLLRGASQPGQPNR